MTIPNRLILFFALSLLPPTGHATETIHRFDSEISIHRDASMQVVETITVSAEGNQIKHGIYRDFPTDYRSPSGQRYQVGFKVLGASRDGHPEPFHITKRSNGVRIYIGAKNHYLEPGTYTYTLRYQTNRQLGFFADHDELYWNVTGHGWRFPIQKATATVHFPASMPENSVALAAYTGKTGQQGSDYLAYQPNPKSAFFNRPAPSRPAKA
nr:DUF2207 domain-containing protein [Methylomarinum sp. Ch1-1]MDP4521170.1 DUF2207 domain-containing protein [Methylomarinum sp. Ch1-1]